MCIVLSTCRKPLSIKFEKQNKKQKNLLGNFIFRKLLRNWSIYYSIKYFRDFYEKYHIVEGLKYKFNIFQAN